MDGFPRINSICLVKMMVRLTTICDMELMKIEIDQMYLALKEKGKSTKAGKSKQGPLVKEGYRSVCRF
jgi:hypothetical protein